MPSTRSRSRRAPSRRPTLELLERRDLPSRAHFALPQGGGTYDIDLVAGAVVLSQGQQTLYSAPVPSAAALTITGTAADESFDIDLASLASRAVTVTVLGGGGDDTIALTGTPGNETVVWRPGALTANTAGTSVQADGFAGANVSGNGGNDTAVLYDSPGNDTAKFNADGSATLSTAAGDRVSAAGFGQVKIIAINGGHDSLTMSDTAGNDKIVVTPKYALRQTAGSTNAVGTGFETVHVTGGTGGQDAVWLYDSAGDDTGEMIDRHAELVSANGTYAAYADGFGTVRLVANAGGHDQVSVYGTAATDLATFVPHKAGILTDAAGTTNWQYNGFADTIIYANKYGTQADDTVRLYDSPGTDIFDGPNTNYAWGRQYNAADDYEVRVIFFGHVQLIGRPNERNLVVVLRDFPPTYELKATNYVSSSSFYAGLWRDSGPPDPRQLTKSGAWDGPLTNAQALVKLKALVLQRDPSLAKITDPLQLAIALRDHVHQNIRNGQNTHYWARLDPYHRYVLAAVLHYERVQCGGTSLIYHDVLQAFGFTVRHVNLYSSDGTNGHSTVEVLLHGHWIAEDATFDVEFRSTSGVLINYAAMQAGVPYTYDHNGFTPQPGLVVEQYPIPYKVYLAKILYAP